MTRMTALKFRTRLKYGRPRSQICLKRLKIQKASSFSSVNPSMASILVKSDSRSSFPSPERKSMTSINMEFVISMLVSPKGRPLKSIDKIKTNKISEKAKQLKRKMQLSKS